MIKIKTIVEIIDSYDREDMGKEFKEMSLADLRNYCLENNSSALEEELKSCVGDQCEVHIKHVEVTEE